MATVLLSSVPRYHQFAPGHRAKRLDDQVHALVGHQARHGDVVVVLLVLERKLLNLHRRIQHPRPPPVGAPDSLAHVIGVGQEQVDVVGGLTIPKAQAVEHPAGKMALDPGIKTIVTQVLEMQVPRIAHRGMNVADVQLFGGGQHAFCKRVGAGDDDVGMAQVQRLHRERRERQVVPEPFFHEGHALQKGGLDVCRLEPSTVLRRKKVDRRRKRRLWQALQHRANHIFGAAPFSEPFVGDVNQRPRFVFVLIHGLFGLSKFLLVLTDGWVAG
jgi:hypothetical protein